MSGGEGIPGVKKGVHSHIYATEFKANYTILQLCLAYFSTQTYA